MLAHQRWEKLYVLKSKYESDICDASGWRRIGKVREGGIVCATKKVERNTKTHNSGTTFYDLADQRGLVEAVNLTECPIEEGFWVFKVTSKCGVPIRSNPDYEWSQNDVQIPFGSIRSFTQRVKGSRGDWFYRNATKEKCGRGWVFETCNGERAMTKYDIEGGSWTYETLGKKIALRLAPDLDQRCPVQDFGCTNQKFTVQYRVRGKDGNMFIPAVPDLAININDRFFENTWLPVTTNNKRLIKLISTNIERGSTWEYRVDNGGSGADVLSVPTNKKNHFRKPRENVPTGMHIFTECRVKASKNGKLIDNFFYIPYNGGWLSTKLMKLVGTTKNDANVSSKDANTLNNNMNRHDVPHSFICSITRDIMKDPVMAADGHTYERKAITDWLCNHSTSPNTNLRLPHRNVISNINLKAAIRNFQRNQK